MTEFLPGDYWIGADLGQSHDPTAIVVLERLLQSWHWGMQVRRPVPLDQPLYHVRHLERMRGVPYPDVVRRLGQVVDQVERQAEGPVALVVDGTGVGRAIVDMLVEAQLDPIALTIHGGDAVHVSGRGIGVPKRDLVAVVATLLQTSRLKFAADLPQLAVLIRELTSFKVRIDPRTAHDSYAAWREGDHDDCVLALACALWYAERGSGELEAGPNPLYEYRG